MTTFFLTGGAGFIGGVLAARLAANEEDYVSIYDNLWRNTLQYTNLLSRANVSLTIGDVRDEERLRLAMAGADCVVHLASVAGVGTVMQLPAETFSVVTQGTRAVLRAASACGARQLIDFSTSEIFGPHAANVSEKSPAIVEPAGEPRWIYAAAKLAAEHLVCAYPRVTTGQPSGRLRTCCLRPFNVYGPNQPGEGAVQIFVKHALRNEPIRLHNGGEQLRDWCYVDDMVDATMAAIECWRSEAIVGRTFNIGNGQPGSAVTTRQLAERIVELSGSSSKLQNVEWDHPDVVERTPDITLARELLGYSPKIDLDEGLRRTIAWYRERL